MNFRLAVVADNGEIFCVGDKVKLKERGLEESISTTITGITKSVNSPYNILFYFSCYPHYAPINMNYIECMEKEK